MLDISTVVALMALYFVMCGGLTWAFSGALVKTKENFLLADRSLGPIKGMLSISAAWTWATALFLAPQLSYQFGFAGFFWILAMNILTLGLFGFAASKIRQLYPSGFTFAEHIKNCYGRSAHNTYIVAFLLISVTALGMNIYAGSKLIQTLTGLNMNLAALFLVTSAILFSIFRGLRSTNITEMFKMAVVVGTAMLIVPQVWMHVGWDNVVKGMSGASGKYDTLFGTPEAITVFLTTGVYFIFRHISLPWADNSFWQRAFAVDSTKIKRTYFFAAVLFSVAPVLFASLGFVANGAGIVPGNVQMTNVEVISQTLGPWALTLVTFMLLTALTSILDSQFTSVMTLINNDVLPQIYPQAEADNIDLSRTLALVVVLLSWGVVNIPGVNILYFGFLGGCICMSFFVPSLIALFAPHLQKAKSMVMGILIALLVGFPVYAYASLNKLTDLALVGFFGSLIVPALFSLVGSRLQNSSDK